MGKDMSNILGADDEDEEEEEDGEKKKSKGKQIDESKGDDDERLVPDLSNRDPDDAFSSIPYEKGRLLLVYLENAVGRDAFDQFLRTYFDRHAFQSMSTESFLIYIDQELLTNSSLSLDDIKKWIYEPGLPDDAILPSSQSFDLIDKARSGWLAGEQAAERLDSSQWSVHEWLYFLNNMPESLTDAQLAELDHSFNFTQTRNNEIAHSWLLIAVRHRYQPAIGKLFDQYWPP